MVRLTVANEVAAANDTKTKHMFRSYRKTPKGSQTRLYIETDQALAAMLIAIDDQPLTAAQLKTEADHLAWLVSTPTSFAKSTRAKKKTKNGRCAS